MKQFTLRGFLIGLAGLSVITFSSMYVALRMGALPWPTVFVTVLSMVALGRAKNSSVQEINVTHTLMSAGSMVAGALAFTMPGIWILDSQQTVPFITVLAVSVLGAILGVLFSALFRKNLIEEQNLVFPIGNAAYETLVTGLKNGRQSVKLFISMVLSVIFTLLRDAFGFVTPVFSVFKGSAKVPAINIWLSPMAMAIGAMIDRMASLFWVLGCIISYFVLSPLGFGELFKQNLGIGLMLGTGVGILCKLVVKIAIQNGKFKMNFEKSLPVLSVLVFIVVLLCIVLKLSLVQALISVLLCGVTCLLSGMLTGSSGINPMEIFGIIVMLAVGAVKNSSLFTLFCVASMTAVACGLSGDVMNDLKSGSMLKTDPKQQLIAEGFGAVIGALLSAFALFAMKKQFGNFGTELLPAPQAKAVASMASSFAKGPEFVVGIIIGAALFLCKLPSATLGLGIYLSAQISIPVGIGAICAYFAKKNKNISKTDVDLISSGLLGGEGIAGVFISLFMMI